MNYYELFNYYIIFIYIFNKGKYFLFIYFFKN